MKKKLFLFIAFVIFGILQAVIFMMVNARALDSYSFAQCLLSLIYALPQSVMVAAWAMIPIFFVGLIYVFIRGDWHRKFMIRYMPLVFVPLLLLCCLDWTHYDQWGHRLEHTALSAFCSYPLDTIREAAWWCIPMIIVVGFVAGWLSTKVMQLVYPKRRSGSITRMNTGVAQQYEALWYLLLTIGSWIVGSGCFGLMGIGSSYFTDKQALNHAATSPIYSLFHSFRQHRGDTIEEFVFLSDEAFTSALEELDRLAEEHPADPSLWAQPMGADSTEEPNDRLLRGGIIPNVAVLMLEDITSVEEQFPSLARRREVGVNFTRCYAESWRADFTEWLEHLGYGLEGAGYSIEVVRGGRPLSDLQQVIEAEVAAAADTMAEYPAQPYFKLYRATQSEVSDAEMTEFLDNLRNDSAVWNNLLLVTLTAGNQASKLPLFDPEHYRMTMLWDGGAVAGARTVSVVCRAEDISRTLLRQMHLEEHVLTEDMGYDIMKPSDPHFAFFTWPYGFGFLTDSCTYMQDNHYDGHPLPGSNDPTGRAERLGKAKMQQWGCLWN